MAGQGLAEGLAEQSSEGLQGLGWAHWAVGKGRSERTPAGERPFIFCQEPMEGAFQQE